MSAYNVLHYDAVDYESENLEALGMRDDQAEVMTSWNTGIDIDRFPNREPPYQRMT